MKARDVIPGWPRGKSTSQPAIPRVVLWEEQLAELRTARAPTDWFYHDTQQFMLDRWLSKGIHFDVSAPCFQACEPLTDAERLQTWRRMIHQFEMDVLLHRLYTFPKLPW